MLRLMTISILMFMASWSAQAGQFPFLDKEFKLYSKAKFTWWGLKIYRAEIWTADGRKPSFRNPHILHIEYFKDIKASKLVETTEDEWDRLDLTNDRKANLWLAKLGRIWPDVNDGDSITTYFNGDETRFYQGKRFLGKIKDPAFPDPFLKIWTHRNSRIKGLR